VPRRRILAEPTSPAPAAARDAVHVVVDPRAVFDSTGFRRLFGLRTSSLRSEVRAGRLRVSKRCGKYYILGQWVIDWLTAGELRRRPAEQPQQ
jgi:hypothetical protein